MADLKVHFLATCDCKPACGIYGYAIIRTTAERDEVTCGRCLRILGDEEPDHREPWQLIKGRIRALQLEAHEAGDHEQVGICWYALNGDHTAIAECLRVMAEAAGADPFDGLDEE